MSKYKECCGTCAWAKENGHRIADGYKCRKHTDKNGNYKGVTGGHKACEMYMPHNAACLGIAIMD